VRARVCVCVVDLSRDEGSARRSLAHASNGSNTVTITRTWFRAVLQGESACVCLPHIAVYGAAVFVDVGLDGEGEERQVVSRHATHTSFCPTKLASFGSWLQNEYSNENCRGGTSSSSLGFVSTVFSPAQSGGRRGWSRLSV
jgi:hypothetical protein